MMVYYFKEDIRNVTEMYYNIVLSALKKRGILIKEIPSCSLHSVRQIPTNSYVFATTLKEFAYLYFTGHRKYIYWYQGIGPEEIYMLKGSKLRYKIDSFLEKRTLKTIRYKIGVSKYLFRHYEDKYHMAIEPSSVFIMPCFNSEMNKESFYSPHKYEYNVFCYAGGTQPWQGFEEIVNLYKKIEDKRSDVCLKVYSKDLEEAKNTIETVGLRNYSIDCIPQSQMDSALASCKYGFIIREDSIINNVATPTKLATYLGSGVIPIFSSSILSYRDLASRFKYLCCLNSKETELDQINEYLKIEIKPEDVISEYDAIFKEYFNKEKYIEELSAFFKGIEKD